MWIDYVIDDGVLTLTESSLPGEDGLIGADWDDWDVLVNTDVLKIAAFNYGNGTQRLLIQHKKES